VARERIDGEDMQCPKCKGKTETRKIKASLRKHQLTIRAWIRCLACGSTFAGVKRMRVIDVERMSIKEIGAAGIAVSV
jgi:hypothetical protein